MSTAQSLKIQKLKEELAAQMPGAFCAAEALKRPQGWPTGYENLDRFLEGGGLLSGALSLICGELGMGGTSLWIEAAAHALREKKWVAWVSRDIPLMPISLQQKGMNLGHFVAVESPLSPVTESPLSPVTESPLSPVTESPLSNQEQSQDQARGTAAARARNQRHAEEKLAWLLQELMSSGLFDLIGCDLGAERLRTQDLRKLQTQARETNIALVFLTRRPPPKGVTAGLFSLILKFERRRILIERALHRPTPHSFSRSVSYARFTVHTTNSLKAAAVQPPSENHFPQQEPYSLP